MNLKKMLFKNLILVVFLAIAISISSLFLPVKVNHPETPSEQETLNNSISATLSLDYDKTEGEIKPTPNLGSFEADNNWDISNLQSIRGGVQMKILIANENTLFLSLSSGGYATLNIPKGYRVDSIKMGNKNSTSQTRFLKEVEMLYLDQFEQTISSAKVYDVDTENNKITSSAINYQNNSGGLYNNGNAFSITPEDLDPEYNGTLRFHATFEPVAYKLYMHHLASGSWSNQLAGVGEGDEDDYVKFNIKSGEIPLSNYAPAISNASADQSFVSWGLDVGNLTKVDDITTSIGYKLTPNADPTLGGTIEVKPDENTYAKFNYTKIDAEEIYHISHLLAGSFGNFGYLENNNASSRPRIKARYARTYEVTINNTDSSSNFWRNGSFVADDFDKNELVGVYVKDNAGAVAVNEGEIVDRSTATIKISAGVESPFMATEINDNTSRAFLKYNDFKGNDTYSISVPSGSYAVYNYGHEITGWNVVVDGSSLNFDWGNNSLGDLAAVFDGYATAPENIVITPIWAPVSIKIRTNIDYATTTDSPIRYGAEYELLGGSSGDLRVTRISYTVTGTRVTVALKGKWNYYKIPADKYEYRGNNIYTLYLNRDINGNNFLDNIYKVPLYGAKTLTISNGGYIFADTGYSSQSYTPTDLTAILPLTAYSGGLIDEYVKTTLERYKTDYKEKIDGDGIDDFVFLRKVHGSTLSDLYVYLAHNQDVGDLPTFDTLDSFLTVWYIDEVVNGQHDDGEDFFTTTNFDPDISEDEIVKSNIESKSTKWTFGNDALRAKYERPKYLLKAETLLSELHLSCGQLTITLNAPEDCPYCDVASEYTVKEGNIFYVGDDSKGDYIAIHAGTEIIVSATANVGYEFDKYEAYAYIDGVKDDDDLIDVNKISANKVQGYDHGAEIKIQAYFKLIEYYLRLNYQDLNNPNAVENEDYSLVSFNIESDSIDLLSNESKGNVEDFDLASDNAEAYAFGGWVLKDCVTAGADLITVDNHDVSNTIDVYLGTNVVLKFEYLKAVNGASTALGDPNINYYYVTKLLTGSYGDFNDVRYTNATDGKSYYNLYAKWSYLYNVTISNSEGYWKDKIANPSDELMGVTVYNGIWNKGTTGTIQILYSSEDQNNQFMSTYNETTSLAFKKASEITSYAVRSYEGKYAVYNYGHEINGWLIYVIDGARKQNYLVFDNANEVWTLKDSQTTNVSDAINNISNLIKTDQDDMTIYLESLAGFIDDYYLENHLNLALTMVPRWQEVEISATVEYDLYSNDTITTQTESVEPFKFGARYNLTERAISGKKQVFVSNDSNKVALAGDWNYTNLNYNYDKQSGLHKVELVAYKITDKSDYSFANALAEAENVQTMAFDAFAGGLIDEYIDDLKELIEQYEENIDGDGTEDFEILRKVYATNGTALADGKSFTTAGESEFYIYLANDQSYGQLPTIDTASSQLIFYAWQKAGNNGRIYFTENYSDTDSDHVKVFEENNNDGEIPSDDDNKWTLAETGYSSGTDIIFKAYYAGNKFVYVDVNTILGEDVGKYGYALIYVDDRTVDNSKDAKYLVVYNNDPASYNQGMQYYSLDVGANLSEFKIAEFDFEENDPLDLVVVRERNVSPIKWYVGSVLEIYVRDQSQDIESMNSGDFDDMIGYKFSSISTTYDAASNETPNPVLISDLLTDDASNSYVKFANKEFIEDNTKDYITTKPLESASVVTLNIAFEMLNYSFEVKLDDTHAGSFTYSHRGVVSSPYTATTINNVQVGNNYLVNYVASVGYEFKTNAFVWVINGVEIVALTYSSDNITTQSYSFTIDGSWLRENYYLILDANYRVDYKLEDGGEVVTDATGNPTVKIGLLEINTKPIEFSYGVKVYDSTQIGATYPDGIIATEIDQYVDTKLSMNNGKMAIPGFAELLSNYEGMWVYKFEDDPHAILNSRMFFPRNMTTQTGNNFTEYDFLWMVEFAADRSPIYPTTSQEIDTMVLLNMVNIGAGAIVPLANRTLYMMIEVRELYSIEMVVKVHETQDTNSTERSTTLTNAEDNSFESIVGAGADKMCAECGSGTHTCLETYFKQENGLISTMAYTYKGLKNTLTSEFDGNRYQGVNYYQNSIEPSAKLESTEFECESNIVLYIEYVPSVLTAQLKFFVDGSEKTQTQITADGYLNLLRIPQQTDTFVLNETMEIVYQIANAEYDVETKVSGAIKSATMNNGRYTLLHQIVDADYNTGVIIVEFLLRTRPSSNITVRYQLYDNNQSMAGDDYGTFKILVGGVEKIGSAVDVMEGKSLKVDMSGLSAGYEFHELRHNNLVVVNPSISGNVITITDSYVAGNASSVGDSGSYVIFIKKTEIKVVLEKSSDLENWSSIYQIKDGQTYATLNASRTALTLSGLYVGKQVTLVSNEQNTERLQNFYYYLADRSNKVDLVSVETLQITSDLIEDALNANNEIRLGFDLVKKYRFNLVFTSGRDLADDVVIKANGQDYISGTYIDEGSEIALEITTLVEGKYKIILNGETANKMDSVNETYTLTENKTVVVDIVKTKYGISVEESVYDTIESLDQGNPSSVDVQNHVNGLNTSVVRDYGDTAVLHIKRVHSSANVDERRILHTLKIVGNDLDGYFKISFNTEGIASVWYNDGVTDEEISLEELEAYGIKVSTITNGSVEYVKIEYLVSNIVELYCDYATYKTISGE